MCIRDRAWLRAILDPLLGAIEKLHSEGVYHRDIAPDNIQICLLYTSDAADERSSVDLGGRRIIKKKQSAL